MVIANGGIMNKHSVGVYGAKAPTTPWHVADRASVDASTQAVSVPNIVDRANGEAKIETYSASYKKGESIRALVISRLLENDARCMALVPTDDRDTLSALEKEAIGCVGKVTNTGKINHFTL